MSENRLKQIFYLLVLVISFLFLISFVPEFTIFGYQFKNPDLLADIRLDDKPKVVMKDSSAGKKDSVIEVIPIHKPGPAHFEDFGKNNLSYFVNALRTARRKPVRVAFFGDSFIEGDILCAPFRDTLQLLFGGRGVGYVPITSEVAKFRTTVQHDFSNWRTYSMVGRKSSYAPLGLPGYCFKPDDNNEVVYTAARKNFVTAKIFYEADLPFSMNYVINDTIPTAIDFEASSSLKEYLLPQKNFNSIKMTFQRHDSLRVYGAVFEDSLGVTVDNFSMRSNPGMGLLSVDPIRMTQFNSIRNYKLVILQYGLNVLSEKDTTGYGWYVERMSTLINRMKESFPECSFVLMSIGDRSSNQKGKYATMPGILQMRSAQRKIAQQTGIAFWDMYEAMGGENSMVKYAEATPPLAAKDYTHLTFRGGRKLAKKLADAVLHEKAKYDKIH
jgi:hypothetical protein